MCYRTMPGKLFLKIGAVQENFSYFRDSSDVKARIYMDVIVLLCSLSQVCVDII